VLFSRTGMSVLLFGVLAASPAFGAKHHSASHHAAAHSAATHHAATSVHSTGTRRGHKKAAASASPHRLHGQQSIAPERVTEIQQALIREHYLDGEASGNWDADTKTAMQKYQSDQGWQTKLMPDSRALKKLGLGPDYSNAINGKNSSFAEPPSVSTIPAAQAHDFSAAAGVNK